MAFDQSNLHRNERIVLDTHPSWVMLLKGIIAVVVTSIVGVLVLLAGWEGWFATVLRVVVVLLILASLLYLLQRWIAWISTNFVVTTDRCVYRHGIIAKHGIEIPLERINTVFFRQGVLDRVFRAGTLTIESAGENGTQVFTDIGDPIGVQQILYQQLEDNETRRYSGGTSVADELAKLIELHDAGHLNDSEFESQRARLLGE